MTGNPQFRFTLFNTALYPAGVVVPAPLGWKDASISLERHKEYHSLIEYFKGSFLWYGLARQVIREVEDDQGPEAELRCLIEVTYGAGFETVFDGLIDISQQEDIAKAGSFYKQQAPIIRDDFWAKFINRKSTPVDLEATVDLDGNARTPVSKIVLPLPSQKIITRMNGSNSLGVAVYENDVTVGDYIQVGFDTRELDEVEQVFTLLTGFNKSLPSWTIEPKYTGVYKIKCDVELSVKWNTTFIGGPPTGFYTTDPTDTYIDYFYRINNGAEVAFATANFIGQSTVYSIDEEVNIIKGDIVYIYGRFKSNAWKFSNSVDNILIWGNDNSSVPIIRGNFDTFDASLISTFLTTINFGTAPSGNTIPTKLEVEANTIFDDTETDAYLIKDAAESILSKIVGRDSVVKSDVLTNTCKRLRAIMRGKHVRGYNMSGNSNPDLNKEFFMKFDEWFEGANPLLFLGLGYTEVGGNPKIEIEPISDFYDPDFTVTFDNVSDLVRTYDQDKIFKAIEIGFQKWSSESDSGIDDPQTKRNYRTKFATIGQELKILCKWLAASLAIERSRRNRVELGKDDRNDEEIISICLTEYESGYTPEFSENFDSVTNLLNPDFRYNIRDSVARIVKRWQPFLQGCLQHTTGEKLYFASGEGNYSMQSLLSSGDCEVSPEDVGSGLAEDQDIDVTTDFIFIPKLYKAKVPMSWAKYKSIVATRKKAIGISRTTENHVAAFIMELDYKLVGGYAEMLVLLGENTDV